MRTRGGLANHNALHQLTNLSPSLISEGGASLKQEMISVFIREVTEWCGIKVNYVYFFFLNETLTHVRLHPINTIMTEKNSQPPQKKLLASLLRPQESASSKILLMRIYSKQ